MANKNPYQQYKSTKVETASQEKLVLMLYNGALKFAKQAKQELKEEDYEQVNNLIKRTQDILMELWTTLDMEEGGEIAENLELLYDYMNRQLVQANAEKDKEALEEVIGMFQELKETWQEAVENLNQSQQKSPEASPANKQQPNNYQSAPNAPAGGINFEG